MTRSDIAALLILLAFLALCWVASLIVRVGRKARMNRGLRLFLVRSPGPLAYIAAPTHRAAIELFCSDLGNGDDEDRSELEAIDLGREALINIPDADEPGPDERTAAQWIAACNGIPTIVGHTEV